MGRVVASKIYRNLAKPIEFLDIVKTEDGCTRRKRKEIKACEKDE